MSHPTSAVIRKFADQLDAYFDKYGALPEKLRVEFRYTNKDFARLCQHFDLPTDEIPEHARGDKYWIVRSERKEAGVTVGGWNFISELCERKTVMKEVEVWSCGDTVIGGKS